MKIVLLFIFGIVSGTEVAGQWTFDGVLGADKVEEAISFTDNERTIFHVDCNCSKTSQSSSDEEFVQYKLYETSTLETIIFVDVKCDDKSVIHFSQPLVYSGNYNLSITGKENAAYYIEVSLENTTIALVGDKGSAEVVVPTDQMIIKSFDVTDEDIITTKEYSYIQVKVSSEDKFLEKDKTGADDPRFVAILMVTKDPTDISNFFENPEADRADSMRLSFSTFGMITISNASVPALASGTWFVGLSIRKNIIRKVISNNMKLDKRVTISINIRTDYEYRGKIAILFLVALLGILIPLLARLIFDAGHLTFTGFKWEFWFLTLKNWFWSGRKGLTYLTTLLAALLIVSAFQVVHAKYSDMISSGNRDTCYYNEKCFRPYGSYYDVSVNGISSNLPFMVHGVILVIYFSFCEAYCRSNNHKYFDYSIPYSFGLAFICEGFGSLLYHICPSQIIFQFDTLFMFVITIIMIIGVFEGHSIRENDIKYSMVAKHKAIRTAKVFAFFVGPVYYFNFIGNLIATEGDDDYDIHSTVKIFNQEVKWHGLPVPFIIVFYIIFGIWWVFILTWAAYKMDLLPDVLDPKNNLELDEIEGIKPTPFTGKVFEKVLSNTRTLKSIVFGIYCVLVATGFVFALLRKVPFSIFILGILVVAVLILTLIFFVPLMWTMIQFFYYIPLSISHKTYSCNVYRHFLVIFGIILYVLVGCVVTGVSLLFFTYFSVTDKSISAARSRELNNQCYLNDFYDTHDFWHLFASFALMMMTMLNVQISKPCRDCYVLYLANKNKHIRKMTLRPPKNQNGDRPASPSPDSGLPRPRSCENPNYDPADAAATESVNQSDIPNVQC